MVEKVDNIGIFATGGFIFILFVMIKLGAFYGNKGLWYPDYVRSSVKFIT
jgi:hypothetical protein